MCAQGDVCRVQGSLLDMAERGDGSPCRDPSHRSRRPVDDRDVDPLYLAVRTQDTTKSVKGLLYILYLLVNCAPASDVPLFIAASLPHR